MILPPLTFLAAVVHARRARKYAGPGARLAARSGGLLDWRGATSCARHDSCRLMTDLYALLEYLARRLLQQRLVP